MWNVNTSSFANPVKYIYIYNSKSLDVVQSLYFGSKQPSLKRTNKFILDTIIIKLLLLSNYLLSFICTFLTKVACCRNIEIVLHPATLSYI